MDVQAALLLPGLQGALWALSWCQVGAFKDREAVGIPTGPAEHLPLEWDAAIHLAHSACALGEPRCQWVI